MLEKPLILVTNDDGVHAKGIREIVDVLKPYGDIIVVAPDRGNSAKGHSVTLVDPIYVHKVSSDENVKIYACSGTPADCVKLALHEIVPRKPDFLVSGINHGCNSSINIVYSGTMGAAIEGAINGIPSIGFSILSWNPDADFTVAKKYSKIIFENMLRDGLPEGTTLNVNFPYCAPEDIKGIKMCRQTKGTWKEEFDKRLDPHKREYYWLCGNYHNLEPLATDTDEWALKNNYVAVVPVTIDYTNYSALGHLQNWNLAH